MLLRQDWHAEVDLAEDLHASREDVVDRLREVVLAEHESVCRVTLQLEFGSNLLELVSFEALEGRNVRQELRYHGYLRGLHVFDHLVICRFV